MSFWLDLLMALGRQYARERDNYVPVQQTEDRNEK